MSSAQEKVKLYLKEVFCLEMGFVLGALYLNIEESFIKHKLVFFVCPLT